MEKKKLAILIRGQTANEFYSHKKYKKLDWKVYKSKYEEIIKKYEENYEIDVFIHTFESNYLNKEELLEFYCPKAYSFTINPTKTDVKSQSLIGENIITSIRNVINLYFNYSEKHNQVHDMILMMRYDCMPDIKTNLTLLDPNNYNVYGIFTKYNKLYSEDNILFTSPYNLKKYYDVLLKTKPFSIGNLHWVIGHLDKQKIFDMKQNN